MHSRWKRANFLNLLSSIFHLCSLSLSPSLSLPAVFLLILHRQLFELFSNWYHSFFYFYLDCHCCVEYCFLSLWICPLYGRIRIAVFFVWKWVHVALSRALHITSIPIIMTKQVSLFGKHFYNHGLYVYRYLRSYFVCVCVCSFAAILLFNSPSFTWISNIDISQKEILYSEWGK